MTAAARKRYHAWRAQCKFDHDQVKAALQLKGYIRESTNELDDSTINMLVHYMRKGDLMKLPPCPDTDDARAVEEEKASRTNPSRDRKGAPPDYTGHKGLMRYYVLLATQRGKAAPISYGRDDAVLKGLRSTYTDEQLQTAMRRYWCHESYTGGHKLQAYLEHEQCLRTFLLLQTVIDGLLPELYDQGGIDRARDMLRDRLRKTNGKTTRRAHVPRSGGAPRTRRPSTAAEFAEQAGSHA